MTVVLDRLESWTNDDFINNGYLAGSDAVRNAQRTYEKHVREGDVTDMVAWGYYFDDSCGIYRELIGENCSYLDLERFKGVLSEEEGWMSVMSAYLRGELEGHEFVNLMRWFEADRTSRCLGEVLGGKFPYQTELEKHLESSWQRVANKGM